MNTEQAGKIEAEALALYPNIEGQEEWAFNERKWNAAKRNAYIAGRSKGSQREKELEEEIKRLKNRLVNRGDIDAPVEVEHPGNKPIVQPIEYYKKKNYHSSHPFSGWEEEYSHDCCLLERWEENMKLYEEFKAKQLLK